MASGHYIGHSAGFQEIINKRRIIVQLVHDLHLANPICLGLSFMITTEIVANLLFATQTGGNGAELQTDGGAVF